MIYFFSSLYLNSLKNIFIKDWLKEEKPYVSKEHMLMLNY